MLFQAAIPPGPAGTPETFYTGMRLGDAAPADRPYVVCNFVSSADGKATARGRTALLGGEGDRAMFHLLRTQVDAVLAGTGTLAVERYGPLTRAQRLVDIRVAEGRAPQPLAVVISRSGRIPFDIPLFAAAESRVAVYAPPGVAAPACGAQVSVHALPGVDGELAGVLHSLRHDHGVRSLLCEGGPTLFTALLAHDLVDELFLTLAPTIVGGQELGITSDPLAELIKLRLLRALEHDGVLFMRYVRA
ncbi:MAG TPA: dihydrofolate reductase family protein [Solirubrobacteraceae bacterium]|jgi:riboflavin biosynthesis pyrimidine reductase